MRTVNGILLSAVSTMLASISTVPSTSRSSSITKASADDRKRQTKENSSRAFRKYDPDYLKYVLLQHWLETKRSPFV